MKRLFGLTLSAALAFAAAAAATPRAAEANPEFYLPEGTPVAVSLSLSFRDTPHSMKAGAPLTFVVKKDIVSDGWIIVPKGALVHGTIISKNADGDHATTPAATNSASPAPGIGGAAAGAMGAAMNMLNNATFAFDWLQLPAGKVRLDNRPHSVETALLGIGAQAYSVLGAVLGMAKSDAPGGNLGGSDMSVHTQLEAQIARGVHVPGLTTIPDAQNDDGGFIDR